MPKTKQSSERRQATRILKVLQDESARSALMSIDLSRESVEVLASAATAFQALSSPKFTFEDFLESLDSLEALNTSAM